MPEDRQTQAPAEVLTGLDGQYWTNPVLNESLLKVSAKTDKAYWSATRKGFYINPFAKISLYDPSEKNAAKLELRDDPSVAGQLVRQRYIFANEIIFGWGLNIDSGQAATGKTFYPRDASYKYAIVRGQTQSQYDYDLLVEWVRETHRAALHKAVNVVRFSLPGRTHLVKGVGPNKEDKNIARIRGVNFQGIIESIGAGHTNTVFAPEFELRFALLSYKNDFLIDSGLKTKDNAQDNTRDAQSYFAEHLSLSASDRLVRETGYQIAPELANEIGYGPPGSWDTRQ